MPRYASASVARAHQHLSKAREKTVLIRGPLGALTEFYLFAR